MGQWLFICDVNLSIDLSILLVKEYDLKTHIKGYHAYMIKWTPKNGEILKARPEPENEYDKYAVAVERCGDVVGHLSKGRSARFAKTVSYFLRASNENCCRVEVTDKRVNLGNGYFTTINVKIKYLSSFFFPFVTANVPKSELAIALFG